jgi:pimeloyl-ACP methyl ester carboxylesterase
MGIVAAALASPAWDAGTVGAAGADDLACNQQPGDRFLWVERGFCDLASHGPDRALGIVIWNHGLSGTQVQWSTPLPPTLRLLQRRGWDVIAIKRHNLADAQSERSLPRAVERTLAEARQQRQAGYRRVVLAGQSFGGYITLEAAASADNIFAAIAMAPGVTASARYGRLDPTVTERDLQATRAERVALVFPRDDALFSHAVRGASASRILTARTLPYFLVDETSDITGHGGGMTARFALQHGLCMAEFLAATAPPPGRFACPPNDEWQVLRELLLPDPMPALVLDSAKAPPGATDLAGRWYGLLGDSVVFFALVEGVTPRILYRAASPSVSGAVREATVSAAGVSAVLSNKARVDVMPGPGGPTLTWTAADGKILKTTLAPARAP